MSFPAPGRVRHLSGGRILPPVLPYSATVFSAIMLWAAFPPLDLGFLVFVGPAPFLWALRVAPERRVATNVGFLFGFVYFGMLLYWIFILGAVAWVPLTLTMSVFSAGYAIAVWYGRTLPAWRWYLIAVGGWALWEFVRSRFPLGGFPWGSLGYPTGDFSWLRGSAQWVGASGWGVIVVAIAAGLVLSSEEDRHRRFLWYPVAVAGILAIAGGIWSPSADGDVLRVAIVQGNSPCPRVHCDDEKEIIYESHIQMTRTLDPGAYDLVVWGENAMGGRFEPVGNPEVRIEIAAEADRLGSWLLVSGTRGVSETEFINSNLLFSPDGALVDEEYRKRHPVPFGEFVPLRNVLQFIPQLDSVPRDMVRGEEPVVFQLPQGPLGTVISFEGAFARTVRSEVAAGARLIVVNTNEGSYGRTPASEQLINMTRMSAAENGVDLIHAAVTGKSTFITADGTVGKKTSLFTADVVAGEVRWRSAGKTIYTRFGDWLQVAAIVALTPAVAVRRRRTGFEFQFRR